MRFNPVASIRDFWRRKGPRSRREGFTILGAIVVGPIVGMGLLIVMGWAMGDAHEVVEVTYENRTSQGLTVLLDHGVIGTVGPESAETLSDGYDADDWEDGRLVEVVDQTSGHLVHSAQLNRDDLRRLDHTIVITGSPLP
jgi:hypothetical protein